MSFPSIVAFRHVDGFEVAFLDDTRVEGTTTAVQSGESFVVSYVITLDAKFRTTHARVTGRTARGNHQLTLEGDGAGHWLVDGQPAPQLDGCFDVDLESSALTNALAVRRLALGIGEESEAPAVWVRALGLSVERLEQHYRRLPSTKPGERYAYSSPAFGVNCELEFDEFGVVLDYPGIATRVS